MHYMLNCTFLEQAYLDCLESINYFNIQYIKAEIDCQDLSSISNHLKSKHNIASSLGLRITDLQEISKSDSNEGYVL